MVEYTRGPYTYQDLPNVPTGPTGPIWDSKEWLIAIVQSAPGLSAKVTRANGLLLAAAPDMLAALQAVASWSEHEECCDECLSGPCDLGRPLRQEAMRLTPLALAKVKGESPC